MTKDALWAKYCSRNPQFASPKEATKLSGAGLKKLFDQTYNLAFEEGQRQSKAENSLFDSIFGK